MCSLIAVDTLGSLDPAVVNTGKISIESSEKRGSDRLEAWLGVPELSVAVAVVRGITLTG